MIEYGIICTLKQAQQNSWVPLHQNMHTLVARDWDFQEDGDFKRCI